MPLADYWVSEKYDGVRGYWDGQTLRTRGGETVAAPAWFTAGWPATPMDGELWAGRGRFAHAQSTTRQQQPDDAAWRQMRFMVFDLPAHGGVFDERLAALKTLVASIEHDWVQSVPQQRVATDAALQALLQRTVRAGGEGLMLHKGSSLYRSGRSDDLIKLKTHDDAEALVVGHLPGKGKHAGRLGALLVEMPTGQRFKLGAGLTDADRDQPPPLGSWVTYRYRGTHDGACRGLRALYGCGSTCPLPRLRTPNKNAPRHARERSQRLARSPRHAVRLRWCGRKGRRLPAERCCRP